MLYLNFTDKNNNTVIDKIDRDFLVKDSTVRKLRNLTIDEIKELINDSSIKYTFYLYALYDDETIKEDLSSYILKGGNLSINYNCGIRRQLSISIMNEKNWTPQPFDGFLWKGSKFKLEIGITKTLAEYIFPAGVFILKDFEFPHKYSKNEIKMEMVDKFGGLDGTVGGKIVDSVYIPRGSNIVQAVKSLLKSEKIEGNYFDNINPLFPSWAFNETTPYTITESSDSTIGDLIIKLLSIINLDVFYDEYGRMCFEEMRENMLIDSSPSLWTFEDDENIYDFHTVKIDFQRVENVIIVEGANINGDIVSARVENLNPKSPTNISIFEPKICKIIDENITSLGNAYLRANYELFKKSLLPVSENFSTILIPILNVNNVITINDKHCGFKHVRFLINSIDIPVDDVVKTSMTISNLEEVAFSVKQ